ncbi:hypothetical protein SynA1544_00988 [Synechococcus sp. A15-44]|nr:bifunctional DNA primase/polymerase [Synechococcus sp. A15-44]QNI63927.1 hypothetical protein SynA1544_00988 [Synechococcus sp. A15-44]
MKSPKPQLKRLQPFFSSGCCLLPCGSHKNPLLKSWPSSPGLSLVELANFPGCKAVGLRTGPEDGQILSIDLDGQSAIDRLWKDSLDPFMSGTFIVGRSGDPWRLKLQFRLTPEQAAEISSFQTTIHTKPACNGAKAEAVEVLYSRRRQVIIGGRHPSGDSYIWFDGAGPEQLEAPDSKWWAFIKECHARAQQPPQKHRPTDRKRSNTRRANPCPVCGRHDGPGGSNLWCEYSSSGLLFCMPGTTFSAPAGLRIGYVVNGWALKKITQTQDGPVHVFGQHDPEKLKRQSDVE